jgi:signal transduction histidine kinase
MLRRLLPVLIFQAICHLAMQAQQATPLAGRSQGKGTLYPIPGGYLEIVREGALTQFARYDDTLGFQAASAAPVFGLNPLDFTLPSPPLPTDRAYLLAAPYGRAALYAIRFDGPPSMTPVWEKQSPPLRKIVTIGDLDGDGRGEVAMVGDSAFVVAGLDGAERFTIVGDFVDAVVYRGTTTRFIVARHDGSSIRLDLIDAATGTSLLTAKSLTGGPNMEMLLTETSNGEVLAVATSGAHPTAYLLDPATLTLIRDPLPLPAMPIAFVPVRDDNHTGVAAIFNSYPAPTFLALDGNDAPAAIDYELGSVPVNAAFTNNLIALISADSIAFFDRELHPLTVSASPGATAVKMDELDSVHVLVSTPGNARIYAVDRESYNWLLRNWVLVVVGIGLALLVGLSVVAARRYRFVRTIYNNLVRVPNSQGVIVLSPSQRVRHLNMSARALLEIAPYIPLGRHIREYLVNDETRPVISALRKLFAEGEEFELRIDVARDGDSRALTFRGRPLIGEYGFTAGYLLLASDITQTLERERLVNWASVAHHIAHEMKTPLGTVTMTAEMLHDKLSTNGHSGSEHLRATSRIIKQTERLRQIVEDLLTVARTETLQRQSADVSLMISSLAHDYQDILPRSVELRLIIDGERFRAMVDVGQLTVALRNLIDNAWQAIGSREGGVVTIAVKETPEEIRIIVQDNGRGMSQQTLAKLFQPFYTEREGGSGIGTVIVKRVIEGHGGTVNVESAQGRGTQFILTLPR